jgi:hypothetical protein
MKKNLMKVIKVLSLCLVLSLFVGVAVVSAQTAPANNVQGPLNVGPNLQSKIGSLRITNGGFRSAGPGLFDDIVVVGYSDGTSGSAQTGGGASASLPTTKKVSFLDKISKFFGLNTEKAVAANTIGVGTGGGITPLGSCNPACTGYSTCQLISAPNNYACVLPACTLNCPSGTCQWGTNGMYCEGIANPVGTGVGLGNLATTTYKLTVNGNSNLNGYTKVEGGLDVAGAVTSGGKNVCLQDGTNCATTTPQTVTQFGGTFTKAGSTCVNKNPVGFAPGYDQCACAPGFTQYTMAQYSYVSGLTPLPSGRVITGAPLSYGNTTSLPVGNVVTSSSVLTMYGCYK